MPLTLHTRAAETWLDLLVKPKLFWGAWRALQSKLLQGWNFEDGSCK